jgi:hypothetical protein
MGTISARMNSRPLFSSSRRIQRRYAKAILDSLPVEDRDPQWLSGCGGLWETGGKVFPEEDLAVQLRQYNEVFIYPTCQVVCLLIRASDIYLSCPTV